VPDAAPAKVPLRHGRACDALAPATWPASSASRRFGVVGDQRETLPHLDRGGQLARPVEGVTDRGGVFLGYCEHRATMVRSPPAVADAGYWSEANAATETEDAPVAMTAVRDDAPRERHLADG